MPANTTGLSAQDIRDAALLSAAAYDHAPSRTVVNGWSLLSYLDLGLTRAQWDDGLADADTSSFVFDNGSAQAIVAISGSTLSISFRGSDGELGDYVADVSGAAITDYFPYYQKFQTLVTAVESYVADSTNGISDVLVTGHSLGGVTAEWFMREHLVANGVTYKGVTFGSPDDDSIFVNDPRVINFGHSGDPVVDLGMHWVHDGNDVVVDLPFVAGVPQDSAGFAVWLANWRATGDSGEHSRALYVASAEAIASSPAFSFFIPNPAHYHVVIGGESTPFDAISGTSNSDFLIGRNRSDLMTGGAGGDLLDGGAKNDFLFGNGGNDHLYGGSGDDRLDGGTGLDTLTGGQGGDTFVISTLPAAGEIDTVTDYNTGNATDHSFQQGEGDAIDVSKLVGAAYAGGAGAAVADLVRVVTDPMTGKLFLQVDQDGAGTAHGWTTVANLNALPAGAMINLILDPASTAPDDIITVPPAAGSWLVSPPSTTVTEGPGTAVTFTITRPDATTAQTVYLSTTFNHGSLNNGDYSGLLNVPQTFAVGETTRTVTINILDDTNPESLVL